MKFNSNLLFPIIAAGLLGVGSHAVFAGTDNLNLAQSVRSPVAAEKETGPTESSDDKDDPQEEQQEKQEAERLRPLAKITLEQAQTAAQASQPGPVKEVQLENEEGNLIYEVTIADTDVGIDAGNGKVLYTEPANGPDSEEEKSTFSPSSIQVPPNPKDS